MIFEKNKFLRRQFYKLGEDLRDMAFSLNISFDQIISAFEYKLNEEINTFISQQKEIGINVLRNGYRYCK
ncbi:hypothetical protein ACXYFN_03265 [Mycoplasma sp. 48589B]